MSHDNWYIGFPALMTEIDQRKIPLHLFTIGFQKPGICADFINRAPRVPFLCLQIQFQIQFPKRTNHSTCQPELVSWCTWPGVKCIVRWAKSPAPCGARFIIREKSHCTFWPLDSRNQESAQIPGFWNPMVKRCNGIILWSEMIYSRSISMYSTYLR